jgi:hypothetical protein
MAAAGTQIARPTLLTVGLRMHVTLQQELLAPARIEAA